ncbi:LacI family DNA-binding transcriptional regulator [Ornithinimicrobium sp. Y1847]|uniref:LacI family DNA-binding transcriptional regulator n=1 Tax=Ornithinimicrobium sp. Y1847 TaxID=3405419 RepID=UPI003B6712A1
MPTTPIGKRATIFDVASAAGVSRQTVSNALNAPERVKPATLERVRSEIDRLGYRPSSAARGMRSQRAGAIGVELNADGFSDVGPLVLTQLALHAPSHDVHLVPFVQPDGPVVDGYSDMSRRNLVDAYIFADTHVGDPRPGWLTARAIPFATFGRIYSHPELTCWADVDGHAGVGLAVEHLGAQGYGTVGYLGWPLNDRAEGVAEDRHRGWVDATAARGVTGPEICVHQDLDAAVAGAHDLLAQLAPGDAVACASDLLALGVLYAASHRGLRVGPDLGLVGFDGSAIAQRHQITSIAQPFEALAQTLLRLVHDQLSGRSPATSGQLLTPSLAPAASTDRESQLTAYTPIPVTGN